MKQELEQTSPFATIVKASAGTGKTFRLSNKFISLLAAGEKPERILATTFTRKAAGEIRERLFLRLAEACLNQEEAESLSDFIGAACHDTNFYESLLQELIKNQHRLRVCTLDSLCIQIASSFSYELGLPAGWGIMDESVNREIVTETVQNLLEQEEGELLDLIRLLNAGDFSRSVSHQIYEAVIALHELYRQTDREAWHWLKVPPALSKTEVAERLEQLTKLEVPLTTKKQPNKNWLTAKEKDCNSALNSDWRMFIKSGLLRTSLQKDGTYYKAPMEEDMRACYLSLYAHARSVVLAEVCKQTSATYDLLERFDKIYEEKKYRARQLRFNDVKYAIAGAPVFEVLHQLYYRLDSKLSHLLLDEFQDTSFDEWQVIYPLADEILSKVSIENSFFCVGDVKQAIYGWRGGLAEIFHSLKKTWSQLSEEELDKTYRCAPTVIEVVNKVFMGIACNPALADYRLAVENWASDFREHESKKKEEPGYAEIRSVSFSEDKDEQESLLYGAVIDIIRDQYSSSPETTMSVLFRTNNKVAKFIRLVRAECPEIEVSEEGRSTLVDSELVRLVMAMVTVADNPANTVACFHVASSPLGKAYEFTDYEDPASASRFSYNLRTALQTEGYGRTLQKWYFKLLGLSSEDESNRLKQLVELAFVYDKRSGGRAKDFIEFIKLQKVESQKEARLRVMTVHQSKGLEFDTVILPDLDDPLNRNSRDSILSQRLNPLSPVQRVLRNSSAEVRALEPAYEAMYQNMQDSRIEEALSILYVALTRAKSGLHILICPSKESEKNLPVSYAGVLRAACGYDDGKLDADNLLHETGKKSWFKLKEAKSGRVSPVPEQELKPAEHLPPLKDIIRPNKNALLQHKSPSKLAGGSLVDLSSRMKLRGSEGMLWGDIIHSFFECIEWIEDGLPEKEYLQNRGLELGAENSLVEKAAKSFYSYLKNEQVASCMTKSFYSAEVPEINLEVWRERPFTVRVKNTLYKGVFDRVVVGRDSARSIKFVDLLDFKTDGIHADDKEEVEEKVLYYTPQIEAYRQALSKLLLIDESIITAKLLFLSAGMVVSIQKK